MEYPKTVNEMKLKIGKKQKIVTGKSPYISPKQLKDIPDHRQLIWKSAWYMSLSLSGL